MAKPFSTEHTELVAPLPYALPRHTFIVALRQFGVLLRLFLSEYRTLWFFYVFFGFVWPLGFIFFITTAMGPLDREQAIFILGGNIATAVAFGPAFLLINKIGVGRERHEFDYWSTLPMPKLAFVLALNLVALLLALPGLLGAYLAGTFLLGLPLVGGLPLLLLIPFGALPLAGFGALVGSYANDAQTANVLGNILTLVVGFLSPMLVRPEQLPLLLRVLAFFIPTTYVADLFRALLGGQTQFSPLLDLVIIVSCSAGFLFFVQRKMDWRVS
ncbi:MAG: hypothetical protein NVS2B12_07870 [Ktedonobacteraceae bacterium]